MAYWYDMGYKYNNLIFNFLLVILEKGKDKDKKDKDKDKDKKGDSK